MVWIVGSSDSKLTYYHVYILISEANIVTNNPLGHSDDLNYSINYGGQSSYRTNPRK